MSEDIPLILRPSEEHAGIGLSAAILSSPDPYRHPVASRIPRKDGSTTNIYRYSGCDIAPIYNDLFNTSRKIVQKNMEQAFGTESGNISYKLLMCGTTPEDAKPALVIICMMNNVEKVQKFFTQERLLRGCHIRQPEATTSFIRRVKQSIGVLSDEDELTLGFEIYGCGTTTRPPVRT